MISRPFIFRSCLLVSCLFLVLGVSCTSDEAGQPGPVCSQDADCDDGQYCNGPEQCDDGVCRAGIPRDCNDGIDCTNDLCDETNNRCLNVPEDGLCDDGDFCNGAELCDPNRGCVDGAEPDCDDNIACTEDSCDEQANSCMNIPDDALCLPGNVCTEDADCDDGLFCNGAESCSAGFCVAATSLCAVGQLCNEDKDECRAPLYSWSQTVGGAEDDSGRSVAARISQMQLSWMA